MISRMLHRVSITAAVALVLALGVSSPAFAYWNVGQVYPGVGWATTWSNATTANWESHHWPVESPQAPTAKADLRSLYPQTYQTSSDTPAVACVAFDGPGWYVHYLTTSTSRRLLFVYVPPVGGGASEVSITGTPTVSVDNWPDAEASDEGTAAVVASLDEAAFELVFGIVVAQVLIVAGVGVLAARAVGK